MSKDNRSFSLSEDEADSPAAESAVNPAESDQATRFQCPPDFVSFCHEPCSSTLAENLGKNKNELWLIKAPASFDPNCFSGIKLSLSGLQTLKVPTAAPGGAKTGRGQQIYNVLASNHATPELHLLTGGKQASGGMVLGPAFSGLLNVCESYSSAAQAPQVIPAAPAPSIPPGLKQRFQPFGSKTPTLTCVAESEADGAALGPSSTTLRPLVVKRFVEMDQVKDEEGEGRKKRKKKKKEKQIKTERVEEVVTVKLEPVDEIQEDRSMPFQGGDYLVEKRKKKKKKRDREREEVEEGLEPSVMVKMEEEAVPVKCEPRDSFFDDVEASGRKKKKKKLKTDDD